MNASAQLQLPADGFLSVGNGVVELAGKHTTNWPADAAPTANEDPRIFTVRFNDGPIVHPELIEAILAQAARQPLGMLGFGGKKVREPEVWNTLAGQLITRRALMLFCKCYNVSAAHTTDMWANVMEAGDYSYPHCHYDSTASLVYYLDPGEPDPREKMAGRFHLSDPRIPYCCSTEPERPTRGLLPDMRSGTMLMFPAEFVHFVHPYRGRRPRITVAWNISPGPAPAEKLPAASDIPRGMFK